MPVLRPTGVGTVLPVSLPPPAPLPGPGWYADPFEPAALRWWDGRTWTSYRAARSPEREPVPTLPVIAAVGALAITVVALLGSRFVLDGIVGFGWPIPVYVVISGLLGYGPMVAWCVHSSRQWGTGSLRHDLGVRLRPVDVGWAPVIWISCVAAQIAVGIVILLTNIPLTSNTEGINDLDADRGYVISTLVLAVIAAPFVEELLFRGVVLRGLRSALAVVPAVALQAVLFGVAHVDPVRGSGNIGLVLVLAAVGAVLGTAAHLLRRIGPTMLAHAILNAVVMAIVLSG
jgi:membrane protease YdiL (CAAX protease family)